MRILERLRGHLLSTVRRATQPTGAAVTADASIPRPAVIIGDDRTLAFLARTGTTNAVNKAFQATAAAAALSWIDLQSSAAATPILQAAGDAATVNLAFRPKAAAGLVSIQTSAGATVLSGGDGTATFTAATGALTLTATAANVAINAATTVQVTAPRGLQATGQFYEGHLTSAVGGAGLVIGSVPVVADTHVAIEALISVKQTDVGAGTGTNGGTAKLVWGVSKAGAGVVTADNAAVPVNLAPLMLTAGYAVTLAVNGDTVEAQTTAAPATNTQYEVRWTIAVSTLA